MTNTLDKLNARDRRGVMTRNEERRALWDAMQEFLETGGRVEDCPDAYGDEIQGAEPLARLPHARERNELHWKDRKFNFRRRR